MHTCTAENARYINHNMQKLKHGSNSLNQVEIIFNKYVYIFITKSKLYIQYTQKNIQHIQHSIVKTTIKRQQIGLPLHVTQIIQHNN